jgi:hypothetical protein
MVLLLLLLTCPVWQEVLTRMLLLWAWYVECGCVQVGVAHQVHMAFMRVDGRN